MTGLKDTFSVFRSRRLAKRRHNFLLCTYLIILPQHSSCANSFQTMGTNQSVPIEEKEVAYFNHAAQAPLTARVKQAGIDAIQKSPWEAYPSLENDQKVRELYAAIIGAEDASHIALMPSTAFAITLAAHNVLKDVQGKTGRILLLMDEMNSAVYPWQELCTKSDGRIRLEIVPYPEKTENEDGCWTKSIIDCLTRDGDGNSPVLAACLPPLHWSDGSLIDLEAVSLECSKRNIPLIVDATQGMIDFKIVVVRLPYR